MANAIPSPAQPASATPRQANAHNANAHNASEVAARAGTTMAMATKLASPVVISTPVLKIATFHSSSLGSLVASLPALMALRDSFPGAHIDSFARAPLLPLLRGFAGVDEAMARPGGGISSQGALMARLHGAGYDVALSFSQGSNALLLLWATGAPVRAGFVPARMDALLTHKIPKDAPMRAVHALELVRGVGATPRGEKARDFLKIAPEISTRACALVENAGIGSDFLLVSSEARKSENKRAKEAEHEEFSAAIEALSARFSLALVGLRPNPMLARAAPQTSHRVADFGGQTDVLMLAALCEMSRGAFGVGQGVLQLAKLYDKPVASPQFGQGASDAAREALRVFGF